MLSIDHVKGGGGGHRRELRRNGGKGGQGGIWFYQWLRGQGFPPGYQVLCGGCNLAKRNGTECPHQAERRALVALLAAVPMNY